MAFSPALTSLIDALRILPGVGAKSAQRMAFHMLQREREGAAHLARTIEQAVENVQHCKSCRMFTEHEICDICSNERRDPSLVCVVESPADVMAIEQNTDFGGRYFVLLGRLSPIDGIGPNELGLDILRQRLAGRQRRGSHSGHGRHRRR